MSVIIRNRTNLRRWVWTAAALSGIVAIGGLAIAFSGAKASGTKSPAAKTAAKANPSRLLNHERFIENKGQWDAPARFAVQTPGMNTWVTDSGIRFDIFKRRVLPQDKDLRKPNNLVRSMQKGHVVSMEFLGINAKSKAVGEDLLASKQNYLRGGTSAISASVFGESRIVGAYPGIDARIYVDGAKPRYDLVVHPGADPSNIRLKFNGADSVSASSGTNLNIGTSIGTISIGGLYAYQNVGNSRTQVPASFSVGQDGVVTFLLGNYDTSKLLVIDPVVYSTLYGGVGGVDIGNKVVVDSTIHAYVVGQTDSLSYPTSIGAYDEQVVGIEGFCSKFLDDGSDIVYSTLLGGNGDEAANDIAIDALGKAYVVGLTDNTGWLTSTSGPLGSFDAFLVVLNEDGTNALMSQAFGGSFDDEAVGVAVDQVTDIYVVGSTFADDTVPSGRDFPVINALQNTMKGTGDAFLVKVAGGLDGGGFLYSTYLGGTDSALSGDEDLGVDVAVDDEASPYVLISTQWNDAPKLAGSYDTVANGNDSLILKFAPTGQSLSFGTFLGGNDFDTPRGLALDSTNNVYVAGVTFSFNYPKTVGVFDRTYNNGQDSFVTKLNRLGTGLIYSTFCGFLGGASPRSIAVDDLGFAHVSGTVYQSTLTPQSLPVTSNADDLTFNGPASALPPGSDAFLQVLNPAATEQLYCSYFGGSMFDEGRGVGLDGARNAYIVGYSTSSTEQPIPWPTTPGAFKESFPPDTLAPPSLPEGFLAKVKTRIPLTISSLVINPNSVAGGETATGTVTISAPASSGGATVTIVNDNNSVASTPGSITIPEGATTGDFSITTVQSLTTTTVVKITATVEGDSKSANLSVHPWLTALTLSNDTVTGGNPIGGRVTLYKAAPPGGATINMSSTVPAVASVPTTVLVPAGLTTASFDVNTTGVASSQTVDISATYLGLTRTVTLTVVPARLFSISFVPSVVSGGTNIDGTVQLDGNAPNGLGVTVTITASDPALTVPASVTILPQTRSTSFTATTLFVANNTSVTVTAQFAGDVRTAVVDVLQANLTSLTLSPDVVQGGNLSVGTVGMDFPAATGGVTIPLTSNNPTVAPVPASVLIPSGSTNASFDIQTTVVAAQTIVTITATRGGVTLNANLTVNPITFSVSVDPTSVFGGQASVGTVTLIEPAPTSGAVIALASNSANMIVPASITIPSGTTEGTFAITTVAVATTETATVTATLAASSDTADLEIKAPGPGTLVVNPSAVPGGVSATGTVTLTGTAPTGGVVITLTSDTVSATVPATATVPQGSSTVNFTVNTTAVTVSETATITGTANSLSASDTLDIIAANLISIKFVPSRVRGGQTTTMILTLDAAAPPSGAVVSISSSNPTIATIPSSVTIPGGATSRSVSIPTRRVSRTLSTQVTASYGTTAVFTVLTVTR